MSQPIDPQSTQRRARLLVVDDDPLVRRALLRLLRFHCDVAQASSVQEAQTLLARDQDFSLILCDLMMPHLTGKDLHGWLEQSAPALAQRTVFMTGGVFAGELSRFAARVAHRTLPKPVPLDQLLELIQASR